MCSSDSLRCIGTIDQRRRHFISLKKLFLLLKKKSNQAAFPMIAHVDCVEFKINDRR